MADNLGVHRPGCYNLLYELIQGRAFGTPSAGPVARIASRSARLSGGDA